MKKANVSVVIPAFNSVAVLHESLASVASLTYPPNSLELIVVDDGSTDGTVALAKDLLARFPFKSQIITQENSGPSKARNEGWRRSRGQWIQFLDADDTIAADKLNTQLSSGCHYDPAIACLYSPWQRLGEGEEPKRIDPDLGDDIVLGLLRAENFVQLASALIRRDWLEKVGGFNEDYSFIEDVELELRIALAGGRFRRVPSEVPLFTYRERPGSLSRSNTLEFWKGCTRNARTAETYWRSRATLNSERLAALVSIYCNALNVFSILDLHFFDVVLGYVRELDPTFEPPSLRMRALSKLVGARLAYRIRGALQTLRH